MNYLIGKRRRDGKPVLWCWTDQHVVKLSTVATEVEGADLPDWGPDSSQDGREILALAVFAMMGADPGEDGLWLMAVADRMACLPHNHWVASEVELQSLLSLCRDSSESNGPRVKGRKRKEGKG